MKKIILILALLSTALLPAAANGAHYAGAAIGYILLQVEANGEAWYVYPANGKAYYLGRPADAFNIMKALALGAKHDFIMGADIFPGRLSGMILLDVEQNGEAYYIYPGNLKKYYLGRPADAFNIMRELGLGITNADLANIPIGAIGEPSASLGAHGKVLIDNVPFTSQAPFGGWADQRQQDGCEEASSLMAVKWARGQSLTKDEALREITGIADWLLKKYGEYRDISAQNTVDWIFKDYFKYSKAALVHNITVANIIEELNKGNLIITPMNGQIMHNPNYKQPGPPRHMIVIRGYDPAAEEFITNDPPTGYHEIINQIEKNMIVISK
ncbi:C39 family peptidase [Candidatus Falkowbacteria bacterium]|nr:C39 family peptidase [Candidatus Falkowbacteria bacterium]